MCPSSGENTVPMRHLVFVTLYRWLSGMQGALHTTQSSIQSEKYQVSHRYGIFSWWWAHTCPKHVEKSNKHIKKICAQSWFCLQNYTRMHGQHNIKYRICVFFLVWSHNREQRPLFRHARPSTRIIVAPAGRLSVKICVWRFSWKYVDTPDLKTTLFWAIGLLRSE